jgi:replicative superfamily II helicase
VKLIFAVKKAI